MNWVILIIVSLWVFNDAHKRNINYSWLWAIVTFLFILIGLPAYLIKRHVSKEDKFRLIKAIGIGALSFSIIVFFFYHYIEKQSYRCKTCFAKLETSQWRFGQWREDSISLFSREQTVSETNFLKDFISDSNHHHEWIFANGSPYYFFGLMGIRGGWDHGDGRKISLLCKKYEKNLGFREFIQKKLLEGTLSKQKFIEMYSFKPFDGKAQLEKEGNELCDEYDDEVWIKELRSGKLK